MEPGFRLGVASFLGELAEAGATVRVSATYRPPERAYLMHWSWLIARGDADATAVPAMAGVDIEWSHGDAVRSQRAAAEMVTGYGTGGASVAPALASRHTQRRAIDMNISWTGTLSVRTANGTVRDIASVPRDGTNAELIQVGAGYGVIHFNNVNADRPHWSNDGH
ncbi:MAG TPA: hypothetical protein VG734_01670 [Lacunisphaera sp.]|nr:hypothetical protein [Lacunisphaera sp.]